MNRCANRTAVLLLGLAPCLAWAEEPRRVSPEVFRVERTLLGFNSSPDKDDVKAKLLDLSTGAIRIGDNIGSWTEDFKFPPAKKETAIINWAVKNGIEPVYLLSYAPVWSNRQTFKRFGYKAAPNQYWVNHFCPPDDPAVWKRICKETMLRNQGKVFSYEVWNEPNTGFFIPPNASKETHQALQQRYVDLCKATFEAAREVDPKIKVFTCGPHQDFFGGWTSALFALGVAKYSDGIVLHIYTGPDSMASFDFWWAKYMQTMEGIQKKHGTKLPYLITEYGFNHGINARLGDARKVVDELRDLEKEHPDATVAKAIGQARAAAEKYLEGSMQSLRGQVELREAAYALSQTTAMLGSGTVEGMTRFTFYSPDKNEDSYAMLHGSLEDVPASRTLRHLHKLFNGSKYRPLAGASISPDGEWTQPLGMPRVPDTKFYAFDLTKKDGQRLVYVAAWRGRFDYGKNQLIDIPGQQVTIALPGSFRRCDEIGPDGNLSEYKGLKAADGKVSLRLTLDGIKNGKEGRPRAFIFR